MKVALVHDYIKEYGGAERVLETLLEIYPDAEVFTSVYLPSFLGPHKDRFKNYKIHTSWLQYVPFKAKLISPFRLLAPFAFKKFDFSSYDILIVSATGAYFPNVINKRNAKLITYCHTPPRYLYGYATAREWKKNKLVAATAHVVNHFLRMVDYNSSQNVDYFIANSEEVKGRIQKFYRKEATVIYPPVDVDSGFKIHPKGASYSVAAQDSRDRARRYYVTGGRLARAKHVDIIVRACRELDVPLKIFGKAFAGYGEELESLAGKKTEFLGEVSDEEKLELMAGAKAFLFASEDEDFGITPVEAMGVGTPVIAYRSGGVKETVLDGKTGLFFDELTPESLQSTIKKFERMKLDPEACIKQAKKFSKDRFKKDISLFVSSHV